MIRILLKEAKMENIASEYMKKIFPQIIENFGENFVELTTAIPIYVFFQKKESLPEHTTVVVKGKFFIGIQDKKIEINLAYCIDKIVDREEIYHKTKAVLVHELIHLQQYSENPGGLVRGRENITDRKRLSKDVNDKLMELTELIPEHLDKLQIKLKLLNYFSNTEIEAYARQYYHIAKKKRIPFKDVISGHRGAFVSRNLQYLGVPRKISDEFELFFVQKLLEYFETFLLRTKIRNPSVK